jgi:hypothetical protein
MWVVMVTLQVGTRFPNFVVDHKFQVYWLGTEDAQPGKARNPPAPEDVETVRRAAVTSPSRSAMKQATALDVNIADQTVG